MPLLFFAWFILIYIFSHRLQEQGEEELKVPPIDWIEQELRGEIK